MAGTVQGAHRSQKVMSHLVGLRMVAMVVGLGQEVTVVMGEVVVAMAGYQACHPR